MHLETDSLVGRIQEHSSIVPRLKKGVAEVNRLKEELAAWCRLTLQELIERGYKGDINLGHIEQNGKFVMYWLQRGQIICYPTLSKPLGTLPAREEPQQITPANIPFENYYAAHLLEVAENIVNGIETICKE